MSIKVNVFRDQFKKGRKQRKLAPVELDKGRTKLFSSPRYLDSGDTLEVVYTWEGPPIIVHGVRMVGKFVDPRHGDLEAWMEEMDRDAKAKTPF